MALRSKVVNALKPFEPTVALRSFFRFSKPDSRQLLGHEHLLTNYLLDYKQKRIDAYSFACKCLLLLQTSPRLLEHITSELERVGMKLVGTRQGTFTPEIATIAFQDDMFLCPVLAEAQQGVPLFTSLKGALACLESLAFDIERCMATVNSHWAPFVMEMLQYYLDNDYYHDHLISLHYLFREACIKSLVYLNRRYSVLPPSFFVDNITREGAFPVSGGGYADIWKGYMNGSEPICHKVLRIFTASLDETKLFKDLSKEVLIWRQLYHPSIHVFLGICADLFLPSFSIVSSWMEHGNIASFLEGKHGRHLGTDFKIQLIHQVAKGIQYLHEHDPPVIHGDIKGANILISNDVECRITDFGMSTMELEHRFDTSDSAIRGSIPWLAPELMNPEPVVVTRHAKSRDIYALGCTMIEILSGKPPFHDKKLDAQVMISVLQGNRPERPSACPGWIYRLAELCWYERASARPQADFVVDLLDEGMTEDRPPSPFIALSESPSLTPTMARMSRQRVIVTSDKDELMKLDMEVESSIRHLAHRRSSSLSALEGQFVRRGRTSSSFNMAAPYKQWGRDLLSGSSSISERMASNQFDDTNAPPVDYRELWRDFRLRYAWNGFHERNRASRPYLSA